MTMRESDTTTITETERAIEPFPPTSRFDAVTVRALTVEKGQPSTEVTQ